MSYKVNFGTVKNGDTKEFSVQVEKPVSYVGGTCWCTSPTFEGNTVKAKVACRGKSGTTQERTVNGKYADGEDFKIEIQFNIQ